MFDFLATKEINFMVFITTAVNNKLEEMAKLVSKDFTAVKLLPLMGLNLVITGSIDYHWFKSLMLNQLS